MSGVRRGRGGRRVSRRRCPSRSPGPRPAPSWVGAVAPARASRAWVSTQPGSVKVPLTWVTPPAYASPGWCRQRRESTLRDVRPVTLVGRGAAEAVGDLELERVGAVVGGHERGALAGPRRQARPGGPSAETTPPPVGQLARSPSPGRSRWSTVDSPPESVPVTVTHIRCVPEGHGARQRRSQAVRRSGPSCGSAELGRRCRPPARRRRAV